MAQIDAAHEQIACPLCGANQAKPLIAGGDLLHPSAERFQLVSCLRCGHIYQNPRPTVAAIGRYYPDDYMPFLTAIEDEPRWWRRLEREYGRSMRCQALHRAFGKSGRVLDVGCATGIFLDGMRRLGWETEGVELIDSAASYARERFGLSVFQGELAEARFPDRSFDAVTLWDVLEHLHDPQAALDEIARILRPGGLLVMSLPNPDSLEARLIGEHWLGWDLPRHLNLFRPRQLHQHLAAKGMPVERIRSFTAGYSVLLMSLEQQMRAKGRDPQRSLRLLRSWPLRLLAKAYYSGPANWFNLSSIMVVFARRNET